MRALGQCVGAFVLGLLAILVTSCANCTTGVNGAGLSGCSSGPRGGGQTVTVAFIDGTPLAVATQTGSGPFTTTTPGNKVTFSVAANAKYAIAYVCPPVSGINAEFVIQATTKDATSLTASCFGPPSTGTATGSAASAIAGTADIKIFGSQGFGGTVIGASGSFSVSMPTGTNDVAAVAIDSTKNVLGVKLVRSQTVPGAINGGSSIILSSPADATTTANLTVNNVPAGFVTPPEASVAFITANGTGLLLTNSSVSSTNPQPYQALPTAATVSTDFYLYESSTSDTATHNQSLGITTTTTSGGGAFSLALPTPWSFAGPAPAKFPTFTFIYSGFTGLAATADQGSIQWATGATTSNQIIVLATANFQSGTTTVVIPDLTSLAGFIKPAASGTAINWVADIFGGTTQVVANPPANSSLQFVQNSGTFTQP
jgi:hypothetical protein